VLQAESEASVARVFLRRQPLQHAYRDDNRVLEISASSSEFTRSSEIQLDGIRAPRLSVIDYRGLPSGIYEVSAVLIGSQGKRTAVSRFVQILPTPGQR
jgi:hypothetical protein